MHNIFSVEYETGTHSQWISLHDFWEHPTHGEQLFLVKKKSQHQGTFDTLGLQLSSCVNAQSLHMVHCTCIVHRTSGTLGQTESATFQLKSTNSEEIPIRLAWSNVKQDRPYWKWSVSTNLTNCSHEALTIFLFTRLTMHIHYKI